MALDPDQFLDDGFNRLQLREAALRDDAMRRAIGFFKQCVGLRVFRYSISQRRDLLSRRAAKPKKRPEQQSVRIEKYPEDTGGGPVEQFDACRHLRPSRSSETRLELRGVFVRAVDFARLRQRARSGEYQ